MSRTYHQNSISAEITGDIPVAMWIACNQADEDQGYHAQRFGWAGCLDAPELLPTGGCQIGFEGHVVANNQQRGA